MYGRPAEIWCYVQFESVVKLAHFYGALPSMSQALSAGTIFDYRPFIENIPQQWVQLFVMAVLLRDQVLFRECIIHSTRPWTNPRYRTLRDPILKEIAQKAYLGIVERVTRVRILIGAGVVVKGIDQTVLLRDFCTSQKAEGIRVVTPMMYRHLLTQSGDDLPGDLKGHLEKLLCSKLTFYGGDDVAGGHGSFHNSFLCAEVADEDLPWDLNEKEW